MIYYKDNDRKPYAYEDDTDQKYIGDGLTEITESEFEQLVEAVNTPSPEELLQRQIEEAKRFLASTDFKMLPHYEPEEGDDMEAIIAERSAKRQFIRDNS